MYKKRTLIAFCLIIFLIGIFFILNFNLNITGTAFGVNQPSKTNQLLGFILIISSVTLFFGGIGSSFEETSIKYKNLDEKEVCKRMNNLLKKLKKDYKGKITNLNHSWDKNNHMDFSFSTQVFEFKGGLLVKNNKVTLEYNLPFTARLFKDKIVGNIKNKIKTSLAS